MEQYCGHKNADNVGIYIRTFREFLSYLLSTINQEHSHSNPKFRINFPPNLTNSPPKFQMYQIPQNTKNTQILKIPIFMIPTCRCQCSGSSGWYSGTFHFHSLVINWWQYWKRFKRFFKHQSIKRFLNPGVIVWINCQSPFLFVGSRRCQFIFVS